jgi:hypothetical protein
LPVCFGKANLASYLGCEWPAGGTGHLLQGLRNRAVGEHVEERRLPQGKVEHGLQSIVEYCIVRAVGKIGENDGVFVSQRLGAG